MRMKLGMVTVLWAYLRNNAFKTDKEDYHTSADLTGQANHLAVTIEADIVKQKQPTNNGGYKALKTGQLANKAQIAATVFDDLTRAYEAQKKNFSIK